MSLSPRSKSKATLLGISCRIYMQLLLVYPDDFYRRYAEEMQWIFREEMGLATVQGTNKCLAVWWRMIRDAVHVLGPGVRSRLGVFTLAVIGAATLMLLPAIFVRPVEFVHITLPCLPKVYAASAPPSERMITVAPGVQLQVLDWGGTGRPLVLLAGLGSDAHVYDHFAPQLTSVAHVYGITRRGFGASSKPAPTAANYSAGRLAEDVLQIIRALNLKGVVLAGHSIAGEELSDIGSKHPQGVAGLVYLDAGDGYGFYDSKRGDWQIDLNTLRQQIDNLASGAPLNLQTLRSLQESVGRLQRSTGDVIQDISLMPQRPQGATLPTLPPVALAIRFGEQKFIGIHTPVLALFACPHAPGQMSPTSETAREQLARLDRESCTAQSAAFQQGIPQAKVIRIANADHFVFVSNPKESASAVTNFMKTLPPYARGGTN